LKVLISNLGRPRKNGRYGYSKADCEFPDGNVFSSNFFGFSLFRWLYAKNDTAGAKVVVLGTPESSWDALLCDEKVFSSLEEHELSFLEELEKAEAVESAQLSHLADILAARLKCKVVCRTIPYGLNRSEQAEILAALADETPEESEVVFDITHALRHLPLLGLLSAFYLRQVRSAMVSGIYYAAFEAIRDDRVPVVSLDFALEAMDWIEGMAVVERTGRFGVLAELPEIDTPIGTEIRNAAFFENTLQLKSARRSADRAVRLLREHPLNHPAELYRERMRSLLDWTKYSSFAERQLALARHAISDRDYLRAAILLVEAVVSAAVPAGRNPADFRVREETKARINKSAGYYMLNILRNHLAHPGVEPRGKLKKLLCDEVHLRRELKKHATAVEQSVRDRMRNRDEADLAETDS